MARDSDRKMGPCFSECDVETRNLITIREFVRNGEFGAPSQTQWMNLDLWFNKTLQQFLQIFNLRSTALGQRQIVQGIIPDRVQALGVLTAGEPKCWR